MANPKNKGQKYNPNINQEWVNQAIGKCNKSINTPIKKQSAAARITASTWTMNVYIERRSTWRNFMPALLAIWKNEYPQAAMAAKHTTTFKIVPSVSV